MHRIGCANPIKRGPQPPRTRDIQKTKAGLRGFVFGEIEERLQGTILHGHWRVEFRRRYFTRLPQLQRSLDSFLRFYNHQRPHHGYRTRGRTPAEILLGAKER